jgi:hypothetical protein
VLDQKNATLRVNHDRANAERHAARETPICVQNPPSRGLQRTAERIQRHFMSTSRL